MKGGNYVNVKKSVDIAQKFAHLTTEQMYYVLLCIQIANKLLARK